jgi:hypothetical protein
MYVTAFYASRSWRAERSLRRQFSWPGELTAQTRQVMAHIGTILRDLGADYDDVCKVTTVYAADSFADEPHANLSIRSSFFHDPGPATTGIPLSKLAYPRHGHRDRRVRDGRGGVRGRGASGEFKKIKCGNPILGPKVLQLILACIGLSWTRNPGIHKF